MNDHAGRARRSLTRVNKILAEPVCEPCGRRGRYSVERLMAEQGYAKLTDLLVTLANCEKRAGRSAP